MAYTLPNPIRVALADDHTMFRKGVVSILNHTDGMEVVVEGADGQQLIDGISRLIDNPPHVCLVDVHMPVLNGYEALVAAKALYPDMKALVLTMMDHEAIILQMLKAGANGYLLKEDEPEELVSAIRYVMEHNFFTTELVSSRLVSWAQKGINPSHFQLNEREQEFLKYCVTELAYKEIAAKMGVSVRTVEGYRDILFERLQLHSRVGLAMYALRIGLASFQD